MFTKNQLTQCALPIIEPSWQNLLSSPPTSPVLHWRNSYFSFELNGWVFEQLIDYPGSWNMELVQHLTDSFCCFCILLSWFGWGSYEILQLQSTDWMCVENALLVQVPLVKAEAQPSLAVCTAELFKLQYSHCVTIDHCHYTCCTQPFLLTLLFSILEHC